MIAKITNILVLVKARTIPIAKDLQFVGVMIAIFPFRDRSDANQTRPCPPVEIFETNLKKDYGIAVPMKTFSSLIA